MRFPFDKALAAFAIVSVALATDARAARATERPVGFSHMSVPGTTALRGDPSNRLNVVVWYPAAAGTRTEPLAVGPPQAPYFLEGEAALDAPLAAAPGQMPFIVVSHGTGGTAIDLAWLCAGLAASGYVVASVDHPGNNALEAPTVAGSTVWWMRAEDLTHVIDGVLATPRFGTHIDRARIGAAGFSLGGLTVLILAGARTDPLLLGPYCARKATTPVCTGEATPTMPDVTARSQALAASDATYRDALAENAASHRDRRVKAVFSIAPALGPAIVASSLGTIDIPVALVGGAGDPILPVLDNIVPDALAIPDAELTLFSKTVGHYTFLMACAPAGMQKFAPICADSGPERIRVHAAALDLARAFFAGTLK